MERKKMQLSVKRMFILFALFAAAVMGGGCGGGDVAPARPTAHVNGVLHGELADAIYRNINIISSEEDTSDASGDMLMLSSPQFDGSAAAELAGCEYLLTRDAPGFLGARFEKVDADGLLERIAGS